MRPTEAAARRTPDRRSAAPSATVEPRRRVNRMAIWALVLSVLGITSIIGIGLAFKARADIARNREEGDPYAVAALVVGFFYVFVVVVGLCVFWWIRSGS